MLIGVLVAAISVSGLSVPAYAHFIIEDNRTGIKALFHVTPDHDPIAGQSSVISFDFSKTGGIRSEDYAYSLTVKPTKKEAVTVPIEIVSNVILATYTFPSQGFYDVTLVATSKKDSSVSKLQYGQRVSRGVVSKHEEAFGPLEIGAMAGAVVVTVGAAAFSLLGDRNKRKEKK